jgi:hypothetical protein
MQMTIFIEQLVGQIFIKSVVYEKNSLGSFLPFTITQALAQSKKYNIHTFFIILKIF